MSGLPGDACTGSPTPGLPASLLFLLLLLLLLPLGELAGPDYLGRPQRGRLVSREARGGKHAHAALILAVLRVLARRDELGQPGRALEEHDEERRPHAGPVVQRLGGVAAPLVEDEPDGLLGREVGVSAVSPEARADEAAVQVGLLEAARDLGRGSVLLLCSLVSCESKRSAWTGLSLSKQVRMCIPHCCSSAMYSVTTSPSSTAR